MTDYLNKIEEAIRNNWEEQVKTLEELISVRSVDEGPGMYEGKEVPFGPGVQKAFLKALEKGKELGFDTLNTDDYGGHIEMPGYTLDEEGEITGTAQETLGILGHLDVVPEGDGWTHDPFALTLEDGQFIGRGTQDDKGPVVAALFAMKALSDAGFTPHANVRLILGLDEETNWSGMYHYLDKAGIPDFGFTPDGVFPVIRGEKGILTFDLARKFAPGNQAGLQLRSVTGGTASNMVADKARAVLLAKAPSEYSLIRQMAEGREGFATKIIGKSLEITARGVSAHGAMPEKGINAISLMMDFLGSLNFAQDDVNDFLAFYNACLGTETNGTSLGCALTDEESGETVVNVGKISLDQKSAALTLCIRYPVTCTGEQIYEGIAKICEPYLVGIVKGIDKKPIYKPEDDPMVRTMMDVYRAHTGDLVSEPLVIGGGTYARAVPNAVAFGALFPGTKDRMHQAEEALPEEDFQKMTLIFADAIYRLAVAE